MTGLWMVVPGMLIALGGWWMVSAFRPQHPQLAEAFAALEGRVAADESHESASGLDRLGSQVLRRRPVAVSPTQARQLQLRGRTITRHYGHKAVGALLGFFAPLLVGIIWWVATGDVPTLPALLAAVGAVVGFLLPDWWLRRTAAEQSEDATESLLTYFDLITLERLANQSATQALHTAAALSDVATFSQIRAALDRARLQQRMPFEELKELGRSLDLPALVDLSDVMRLDESGASLSGVLRARVRELRDAHITTMKISASAVSERMTVFMVVPSLIFGLFFLVPPLLRIITG